MNTILAIVIVLNLALVAVLLYWLKKTEATAALALEFKAEAERVKSEAHALFFHAQRTAIIAEHELTHDVCSECGKIVTRYDKNLESGKVTCIDCVSKIARGAEIKEQ